MVEAQKKIQRVEGSHIGGLSIKGGGGEGWGSGSNLIHTREKEAKALLWLSGHDFAGYFLWNISLVLQKHIYFICLHHCSGY